MYDLGCKGGTIYRDGSRDEQILATDHTKLGKDASDQVVAKQDSDLAKASVAATMADKMLGESAGTVVQVELNPTEVMSVSGDNVQIKLAPRDRPDVMQGSTYRMNTAYGHLYVTINEDSQGPFEVFAAIGKAGGFFSAQTEAITRMISLALRSNVAIEEIISQLKGIRGPDVSFSDGGVVFSLPDAIAKILEKHIKRNDKQLTLDLPDRQTGLLTTPSDIPVLTKEEITIKTEEKIVETISEDKIKSNGHLTYKKTQKVSIANLGNAPVCPSCANMMVLAEGCMKCEFCGYSKCG